MTPVHPPIRLESLDDLHDVLFNAMADGVVVVDADNRMVDCNPVFHQRLGYSKAEVVGMRVRDLDTEAFAHRVPERVAMIKQQGFAIFETAHVRKDGSVMPVEVNARPCEIGEQSGVIAVVRDISDRKLAQDQSIEREKQLRTLLETTRAVPWRVDAATQEFTYIGKQIEDLLGYPVDSWRNFQDWVDRVHVEDRQRASSFCSTETAQGRNHEFEYRAVGQDGQIVWLRDVVALLKDEHGRVTDLVGYFLDISEQKRTELELRQREHELRTLLETTRAVPWRVDARTHEFVYMGRQIEALLGFSAESWRDVPTWVERIHPEDRERAAAYCDTETAKGYDHDFEYRAVGQDGQIVWIRDVVTLLKDAKGRVTDLVGYFLDVTRQKHIEIELRQREIEIREGYEVYQAAINTPALGFWMVDSADGGLLEVNDAYVEQSGFSRDELLGMRIADVDAQESPEETAAHIELVIRKGFDRFRSWHRRKDGSLWPVEVATSYSEVRGGRFFAFIEDISEKVAQEGQLKLANRVFTSIDQAVVVTDADNRIVSVNPATTLISGYSAEELIGQDPKIFSSGRQDKEFYQAMWDALSSGGHWEGEIWDRRKDGAVYPKWLSINGLKDRDGKVYQYVSIFSDITERKKNEELIWKQANFDSLTGLANRILFQNRLQREIDQCQRSDCRLAVLYIDLDGFKDVNDSLGHAAGDRLLVEVARRLEQRARKSDTVARLGGDEFTLLVTDFHRPEQIGSLAEQILDALREPIQIDVHLIHIGASIGIALCPEDGVTLDEMTKHADTAMYQAKASGKNTFKFFRPEMNAKANSRLALIHDLHRAVREQSFELYYQPKLRLADGQLVGMEALIRWPKGDGQMVSPAEFIPCAEETGLILNLGGWVLQEACRQTQDWNRRFATGLKVAVNLSARQFHNQRLVDEVMHTLSEQQLGAECLELEITESILMDDVEQAIDLMGQMRDRGISIAIDDFGTGYSSLNYLKRFPINTLKIDQTFVRDLVKDSEDAAIVRSVVSLAQSLGLEVVAEGVETAEQLEFLKEHQCHQAQGYFLGRPMPAGPFESFLKAKQGSN